ncbi:DEAD/DEAH box helicase [Candidatus Marsarchaeota archaeon]|nr:DEAD/DEAH box helicase [Candidatus Marsarchaeota archaeon]MCL5404213.1 DEAD/DEAH box helicase [Candidatus Marsarchaeota archaeon]
MEVKSIKGMIPSEALESIIARGITEFTPPQELAIRAGLLDGANILVAAPTASGKTLIAEMACVNCMIASGKKAVYVAPMRAIVSEKYSEFREAYPYIKAAISMGDLDSSDQWLADYEMLFVSTEKLDSLIRHGAQWISTIGCIVFDEVHMLADESRGPTLELLITKLMHSVHAQVIALSATIGNAEELAMWLGAKLVTSDYRPVRLLKGVFDGKMLHYWDGQGKLQKAEMNGKSKIPEIRIAEDTLASGKQAIIFYSTKRNAEAGAVKLSAYFKERLGKADLDALQKASEEVLNVLERPTSQCRKLSECIKGGVAFHHSGLVNAQRSYVEHYFKENRIKVICATTTIGYGVNLPAHTVVIRDLSRHNGISAERLSVNEVLQLFGRAGRPKYDTEGRAILLSGNRYSVQELYLHYIIGTPEPIDSALGVASVLRTHILAFIAEDFLNSGEAIAAFIKKTLYGHQYGNDLHISTIVRQVLKELEEWGFIALREGYYTATRLGKRISELYIDPLSAKWIIEFMQHARDETSTLYLIANTVEMRPYLRPTEEAEAEYVFYKNRLDSEAISKYEESSYGYYNPLEPFATALMLRDWISETEEDSIIAKYRVTPGALYSKLTNADWIAYSAIEIAKLIRMPARGLVDIRVRMRYGIRSELLDLVRLEQIGRVRARKLYANGIKSVADIRANRQKVEMLLGKDISSKVFSQLEG